MSRSRLPITIIACVALATAVALRPWNPPEAPPVPELVSGPVIAEVDGQPVYLSQAQNRYESFASIHDMGLSDDDLKKQVLDSLMKDVALKQGAKLYGITVNAAELAVYVSGVIGPMSQEGDVRQQLEGMGLTFPELTSRVYINYLGSRLYEKVTQEGLALSEDEVKTYFREHRNEFAFQPGEDPRVIYNAVKQDISQTLIKQKQDGIWADWFDEQVTNYELEEVMEDWWQKIERTSPRPEGEGSAGTTGGDASPSPI